MSTSWRSVENKCKLCRETVVKAHTKSGKIVVEKYYNNWGCWQKVQNRSEMQVLCCVCQKKMTREAYKRKKNEAKRV